MESSSKTVKKLSSFFVSSYKGDRFLTKFYKGKIRLLNSENGDGWVAAKGVPLLYGELLQYSR